MFSALIQCISRDRSLWGGGGGGGGALLHREDPRISIEVVTCRKKVAVDGPCSLLLRWLLCGGGNGCGGRSPPLKSPWLAGVYCITFVRHPHLTPYFPVITLICSNVFDVFDLSSYIPSISSWYSSSCNPLFLVLHFLLLHFLHFCITK